MYKIIKKFFRNEQHWENLSFFRNVSILNGLSSRQLGRLIQAGQVRRYFAGETLFSEGQIGKAVFVIQSGRVELTRTASNGKVRVLGQLGPGQVFGEMALLEQRPRTASARVIEDGQIYLLYTATIDSMIRRHPEIGVKLMRNLCIMLSALLRRANQEMDRKDKTDE